MTLHTRGARGDSDLNLTLDERPATASRTRRQPRKKNTPCISDLAGGVNFFLKKERVFFFRGSALQVFGQCGGASMRTKFWQNYFLGKGFAKTSADSFFLNSDVANGKGGVWGGIFHLLR